MNRKDPLFHSFTGVTIEKNEGNFRAPPPRDPHPPRLRSIVQNNRYSIPACRLASPPLSSASLIFPSVLHVPTRCPRPTKVWIIALCRRSGSSRLAAGMTLGSNRGSAPLSRAGESWRGGELVSLTSTKGRGHSDGRTVTIRRATRSNSGSRKFGAVATVILKD